MKLFKLKNNKGITLIEILVAVSIIIILSSASFLGTRTMSNGTKLKMSAQKLASDLRKMQSFVLNLQDYNSSIPDGGWGVYFDNHSGNEDHYVLFADIDNDAVFDDNGTEMYAQIDLPAGVMFSKWEGRILPAAFSDINPNSRLIASFQPPDPQVTICLSHNNNNCNTNYDEIRITLSNSSGSTRVIEINKFGLIDVQN
jgi:type II secretory pathway pseudopilin PulG